MDCVVYSICECVFVLRVRTVFGTFLVACVSGRLVFSLVLTAVMIVSSCFVVTLYSAVVTDGRSMMRDDNLLFTGTFFFDLFFFVNLFFVRCWCVP